MLGHHRGKIWLFGVSQAVRTSRDVLGAELLGMGKGEQSLAKRHKMVNVTAWLGLLIPNRPFMSPNKLWNQRFGPKGQGTLREGGCLCIMGGGIFHGGWHISWGWHVSGAWHIMGWQIPGGVGPNLVDGQWGGHPGGGKLKAWPHKAHLHSWCGNVIPLCCILTTPSMSTVVAEIGGSWDIPCNDVIKLHM